MFLIKKFLSKITSQKPVMESFSYHITEHCNLNCKGCDHFSPIADVEFANIEYFAKDLTKLSELFKNINSINLMGGEPLLNKNIVEFITIARKTFPKSNIAIWTNGILLSQQNKIFWEALHKNKIKIVIRKYPISFDRTKVKELSNKYKVFIIMTKLDKKNTFNKIYINEQGTFNAKDSFKNCYHKDIGCTFLKDGKIYPCTIAPNSIHFSKYFKKNIKISSNDYINIHEVENGKEILDFIKKPIDFCRYCDVKKREYDIPWDYSQKDISEWS